MSEEEKNVDKMFSDVKTIKKWRKYGPAENYTEESLPYTKCPNCGEYKFREFRTWYWEKVSLFAFKQKVISDKPFKAYCSNCQYEVIY